MDGLGGTGMCGTCDTATLEVVRDPRVAATEADLQAQYELARAVLDEIDHVNAEAVKWDGIVQAHAKDWPAVAVSHIKTLLGAGPRRNATGLRAIAAGLERVEGAIESAPAAPTIQERKAFAYLQAEARRSERKLLKSIERTLIGIRE